MSKGIERVKKPRKSSGGFCDTASPRVDVVCNFQTLQWCWTFETPRVPSLQLSANWRHCFPFHFLLLKCLTPSSLTSPRFIRYLTSPTATFSPRSPTHCFIAASFSFQRPTQHFRLAPPREPTTTATAKTHLRQVSSPSYISPSTSLQQTHLTPSFRDRTRQNVRRRITPTEARGRRAPEH